MTSLEITKQAAKFLDSKKGIDIKALQIRELSTLGDYFVLASASSVIQAKALSDAVEEGFSALGIEPRRVEGYQTGMWIVLDYYDVIIHIFSGQNRDFYGLERLWADAPQVPLELEKAE